MESKVRYGVGEQSFVVMRERECLYVDKTRFIEKIVSSGGQYYFLGRPRRFGKSLFLSMLKCFFQGRRELFKGLYADSMNWDWHSHPVLYLDLNIEKYQRTDNLREVIESLFRDWEKEYGAVSASESIAVRFREIIKSAHEKTGERVVVLVDEYDKPLVNNLHNREMFEFYRNELASLYSNFKSSAEHLRLVFLTGVSRFSHLTIFSGLNNIRDITYSDAFNSICGITEKELLTDFRDGIRELSLKFNISCEEVCHELKSRYDGYRFSAHGEDIYNPFSLVNVMEEGDFRNYWIQSGQATLIKEQLRNFNVDLASLFNTVCDLDELRGLDLENPRPVALLYQTGYLTIKGYEDDLYTLGLPNREVTQGFLSYLLPFYAGLNNSNPRFVVHSFVKDLERGDVEGFMNRLSSMFSSVSYEMNMEKEQNLHNALLILMKLLGLEVETEYRTSQGRIDLFIRTKKYYYIIELKLDRSAQEALDQINEKGYALPFTAGRREVIKIGVNFSTSNRTISEWDVGK